eukprot:gene14650-17133_t
MTSSQKSSISGKRSRSAFEMDASTPESSSQDHYNKLSRTIDSDLQKALSRSSSSSWFDMVVNHRHRVLARRIVEGVDWSWTLSTPQHAEYLQLYQLFLLCKFVAEDFKPSPSTNRLQLSPSPMIDRLWHAHMLHPGKYLEMHTKLGFGASGKMFPCLLEHQPEAANDSYEVKTKRMASLMGMMFYICPALYVYSHLQSSVTPSAYSDIPKRQTEENAATNGVTVKVRHKSTSVPYFFNVGLNTSLVKIVKYMSSQLSIPESRLRLLYHGVQINPSSTVQSLGMNDGNEFYLFEEQSG